MATVFYCNSIDRKALDLSSKIKLILTLSNTNSLGKKYTHTQNSNYDSLLWEWGKKGSTEINRHDTE